MMNQLSFLCDAIYRGSEVVEGAVSPNKLASLAEQALTGGSSTGKRSIEVGVEKLSRGERCQLQIDEKRLRVSTSRRDEGFESDSESASTASGSVSDEALCSSPEIKVIEDHVLRLERLIRKDSGIHNCASLRPFDETGPAYITSSSGAESEEDIPKCQRTFTSTTDAHNRGPYTHTKLQMENTNRDNFLLSDILFCHVMSQRPRIVIIVVKSMNQPQITAHLFECLSQESARTLYSCYYTASNMHKLNRYRINKRKNEGCHGDEKALLDRMNVSIKNVRRKASDLHNKSEHEFKNKQTMSSKVVLTDANDSGFNSPYGNNVSVQNESNVNIIEIKEPSIHSRDLNGVTQTVDQNGVTRIEIGSGPCSLTNHFPDDDNNKESQTMFDCEEVLSALERLSIHSSNNPDSFLNNIGVTSSCPNSLIQTSREIHAARESEKERRLRQRQPPLFIKKEPPMLKIDSLSRKEIRRRCNRSRSEERNKLENNKQNSEPAFAKNSTESTQRLQEPCVNVMNKPPLSETRGTERQSRSRSTVRAIDEKRRQCKGPAPPPPPRRHPNNPSVMLVATKSGQENTRTNYPKETHIVRGTKLVRIDYPLYPPWNLNADINNNPKRIYYTRPNLVGSFEYHAGHHNGISSNPDLYKRSRSKSPAKRPTVNRYIDAVSTFNISQKLKDLSDTVRHSLKNNSPAYNPTLDSVNRADQDRVSGRRGKKPSLPSSSKLQSDDALRPVIKRGKKADNDPRRVTFSAYATVQVME